MTLAGFGIDRPSGFGDVGSVPGDMHAASPSYGNLRSPDRANRDRAPSLTVDPDARRKGAAEVVRSGVGNIAVLWVAREIRQAVGQVTRNTISQGNCGGIAFTDCVNVRSEGVVFRAVGDGSVVDSNFITNAQSGIFLNGGNKVRVTNNVIMNIDALDGIDIQGTASGYFTNSIIAGNTITHVFPISSYASVNYAGCGINEYSGTGVAMNILSENTVNDAYCGVAYVTADHVFSGTYLNTLYATLNEDLYPTAFPPAIEP